MVVVHGYGVKNMEKNNIKCYARKIDTMRIIVHVTMCKRELHTEKQVIPFD